MACDSDTSSCSDASETTLHEEGIDTICKRKKLDNEEMWEWIDSLPSPGSLSPIILPTILPTIEVDDMPSARSNQPQYGKDDKVLCFHGELLYEAKVLDTKLSVASDPSSAHQYYVHYKGWKNTWDDWVSADRIRKPTEENKELARALQQEYTQSHKKPSTASAKAQTKRKGLSDDSSHASEDRQNSLPASSRKRGQEDLDKEDAYYSRPEVRIPLPDFLKSILVDDWEHITKNLLLVTLPSKKPVNVILSDYYVVERAKRPAGSADADILEEFVDGLRDYFSGCLGRLLLYTFERTQYAEVIKQWENDDNKGPGDYYGGEHLLRLIVTMPRLIAQTNMDHQSVQRLREEIIKLTNWIGRNVNTYLLANYEPASQEYVEKARSN